MMLIFSVKVNHFHFSKHYQNCVTIFTETKYFNKNCHTIKDTNIRQNLKNIFPDIIIKISALVL